MSLVRIALTLGDPAGIGPEVLAASLRCLNELKDAVFFVCGPRSMLGRLGRMRSQRVQFVESASFDECHFFVGKPTLASAKFSLGSLKLGVDLIRSRQADALVTAPVSKENLVGAGFRWPGHTEYLAQAFGCSNTQMFFVAKNLKVVVVTRHMAVNRVSGELTKKRLLDCGQLIRQTLRRDFGIRSPRIAVCGLNPHAGENGLFGSEEKRVIAPAIRALRKKFPNGFFGPFSADTVFLEPLIGSFDAVMTMYHDQGLIPFKLVCFDQGVNFTAGLPFVRTSPVHGTAFDIAGKKKARSGSMTEAIRLAYRLTKNRVQ